MVDVKQLRDAALSLSWHGAVDQGSESPCQTSDAEIHRVGRLLYEAANEIERLSDLLSKQ